MPETPTGSFLRAAYDLLREEAGPLHYKELTRRAIERGLIQTRARTPEATMVAQLSIDLKRAPGASVFARVAPGTFALRESDSGRASSNADNEEHQLRIPHYPTNAELCAFLKAATGLARSELTGMRSAIHSIMGTPTANEDWTDPDTWIEERLDEPYKSVARTLWVRSDRVVNPRHTTGTWLAATNYDLLDADSAGLLRLTERGQRFLQDPRGPEAADLDEGEGLLELLSLIVEQQPVRSGELMDDWREYAQRVSRLSKSTSIRERLQARLRNLRHRMLIERSGIAYTATKEGLGWLEHAGYHRGGAEEADLWRLVEETKNAVRSSLREVLEDIDPIAFEHLVRELLVAMGYDDVEVTSPGGDGGVDVLASITLGITSVREVVQVKRHKRTIQRHVLDALRGSLHRFRAVRGTIITTSAFSRGTKEAAFDHGAAPITLIDGEKLLDLLVEHGVGVRKRRVEVLELDTEMLGRLRSTEEETHEMSEVGQAVESE